MAQTGTDQFISLGFQSVDRLFTNEGVPVSNLALLKSDPRTDSIELLLSIFKENTPDSFLFSINSEKRRLIEMLSRKGMDRSSITGVREIHDIDSLSELADLVSDSDFNEGAVLIVDSIDGFELDTSESENAFRKLQSMAFDNSVLILLNYIVSTSEKESMIIPTLQHQSDMIMSLLVDFSQDSISKKWRFEKLPRSGGFSDKQSNNRVVKIQDGGDNLTTNTGGTI